jgi:hypothetical protein
VTRPYGLSYVNIVLFGSREVFRGDISVFVGSSNIELGAVDGQSSVFFIPE